MKKRAKFISVVLALLISISSMAVVAVNAAVTENDTISATSDESAALSDSSYSFKDIEVVSLPDKTEYLYGVDQDWDLSGLAFNILYTNGKSDYFEYPDTGNDEVEISLPYVRYELVNEDDEYDYEYISDVKDFPLGEYTVEIVVDSIEINGNPQGMFFHVGEYTINIVESYSDNSSNTSSDSKSNNSANSSDNNSQSTADTAKSSTSDTASNSSSSDNTDNGTVATGSVTYSLAAVITLLSSFGILLFFNRKRYFD